MAKEPLVLPAIVDSSCYNIFFRKSQNKEGYQNVRNLKRKL